MIVNFFLGWTLVGWVAALAWACTKSESKSANGVAPQIKPLPIPQLPPVGTVDKLERLGKLKEQGILTEAEFLAQKSIILSNADLGPPPIIESESPAIIPVSTSAVEQQRMDTESLSDAVLPVPKSRISMATRILAIVMVFAAVLLTVRIVLTMALQPKSLAPVFSENAKGSATPHPTVHLPDEEIRKQNEIALAAIRSKASPTAQPSSVAKSTPISTPTQDLPTDAYVGSDFEIVNSIWEKGGFGVVPIWHVTIKNLTNRPMGNFSYRADYSSETGIGHNSHTGLLEKRLEPGQTKTFEISDGFIDSQANRAGIGFTTAEFLGLPQASSRKRH